MEEESSKGPSHNNPKEAANYVRAVNLLLKHFVTSIRGFDHYKRLDAWETFLHALSKLLSKLDSAYFIKMDTEVVLDTIPDKACDAFLAHPEEAANRVQQRVSSDKIPDGPEVLSRMRLQGNLPCTHLHVAKVFAVAEKKLHLAISGRKYDPGKKASKRKRTSQDKSASEQQPQDEPVPEQPQDEPVPEQQQDVPATKQQDKASDTLTSLSSDDDIPDYGPALKIFTTKDPSSIPKKPRYSLRPKTEYI